MLNLNSTMVRLKQRQKIQDSIPGKNLNSTMVRLKPMKYVWFQNKDSFNLNSTMVRLKQNEKPKN